MRRWCRCGHHVNAHSGPGTECFGRVPRNERNALGVQAPPGWCACKAFRRSERSWWQYRVTLGPEQPTEAT